MLSGGDWHADVPLVWRDDAAIGEELSRVVEKDHAVAQAAPPLLGVESDDASGVAVRAIG